MEIITDDAKKQVEVWLTRSEVEDEAVRAGLRPLFASCKSRGYRAVVFESGRHDLFPCVRDLLLSNNKR